MTTSDIEVFAAIVDAGSLSAAGRVLRISPAMISKRLARLEHRLGVRLIHRTTRRLELTTRGARYHKDIGIILGLLHDAENRVADRLAAPAGPLRVSAPTSFGRLHIAPWLRPFLDLYPQIELSIDLSDRFVDLMADGVDLAIRIAPRLEPGLEMIRLADSRRVLCASPDYLALHGVPLTSAAISEHKLLATEGQLPWRLTESSAKLTIEGTSHVWTNSSEVVRELTLSGIGISLRSLWDISHDLDSGRLIQILPSIQGSSDLGIFAVFLKTPTISASVSALVRYLSDLWLPYPPWDSRINI
jgi:DNA-binding transcriptional LysR family regulator